jgi:Rieske Fe-S protein
MLSVVKLDPTRAGFVVAGKAKFFLTSRDGRVFYLVSATCPHRGGPLHLGQLDACAGAIRCPWHDSAVPFERSIEHALPLVVRPGAAAAIVPATEEAPTVVEDRLILATAQPG